MRLAAAALILLLVGCSEAPNARPSTDDLDELRGQIAELSGVDAVEVDSDVYDYDRTTEIDVEITTSDLAGLPALVTAATDLVDAAPLGDYPREVRITVGESLLAVSATSHATFDPAERANIFVRWVTDPRVAMITWVWQLELQLVGDGTSDGSLVETVYAELADTTTLDDGGLIITDPGSFTVSTAQHPYTDNRFEAAREIAALPGVSACDFILSSTEDGSFIHKAYCNVDGDPEATGKQINSLLSARGLLDSTDVSVQGPDDYADTHEGTYTFDEN